MGPSQITRGAFPLLLVGFRDAANTSPSPAHSCCTGDSTFQTGFHVAVGLLMALAYVYVVEPLLKGGAWTKGFVYALAVWLLNAFVVLPLTGEGVAGSTHLALAGMVWFAAAHTLFFVWLAVMYSWLRSDRGTRP